MFDAILLGIVEGITEFLPISSTGHLILAVEALGREQTAFLKSFEIVIQFGAILAVVVLYWRQLFVERYVLSRVLASFLPTAFLGFMLYPFVRGTLLEDPRIVLWALLVGGFAILAFEYWYKKRPEPHPRKLAEISYSNAVLIGLCQVAAMVPGVSRSAATILGGLALGLPRKTVAEFSFLVAVPTMFAASVFDGVRNASVFTESDVWFLLVGFITSFLVALAAVSWLIRYIQTHTFIAFGLYRIVAAGLFWLFIL